MNLPNRPAIKSAYDRAVDRLLDICAPDVQDHEAEAFVDAMADLIFTTMKTYLTEEEKNAINH
jgi:hypothetical protein